MLTTKNIVQITELKKAVEYDRLHLNFASYDAVEPLVKTSKGAVVQIDGKNWEGTTPKENVTSKTDANSVAVLVQDALNYLVQEYGNDENYKNIPVEERGWLLLLGMADYGADLKVRNKIQGKEKPPKAVDPAVAKDKFIKQMMVDAASAGKTLTLERAEKLYEKHRAMLEEMEAEDAAAAV